jgi:cation diffusion facilitator family transporter
MDFLSSKGRVDEMNKDNSRKIKNVLWIILIGNFVVAVLKIVIGSYVNSSSMTADGFHSLTDGTSNIVGLIGIGLACKPEDVDHPYGHKKFEMLSGLFIAGMLFFIGGNIVISSISRVIHPVNLKVTVDSIITLIFTIIINIIISKYEYNKGKKLNSYILISDSLHTKSDIYVSIGVLITLISIRAGLPWYIDPIASFIVSLFILHASYEIFKSASGILVDKVAINTDKIKEVVLGFNEVKDVHKIRSRGSDNDIHVDMHIVVEANMSVAQCHSLIRTMENKVKENVNSNIQMIVHIEPFFNRPSTSLKNEIG